MAGCCAPRRAPPPGVHHGIAAIAAPADHALAAKRAWKAAGPPARHLGCGAKHMKLLILFFHVQKPLERRVINPLLKPKGHPTKSHPAAPGDSRPLPRHS
jgi:hypothetical protein